MNESAREYRDLFIQETGILLSEIKQWANNLQLDWKSSPISITEEACGTYSVDKLILQSEQEEKIAEITPIAAFILGAYGRIDIDGIFDSITILYLTKGGPSMIQTMHDANDKPIITRTHYFYKGIDESGWYWIENKVSRKGHKIDEAQFIDILRDISDYEYNCCA
ncbi:MAG: hypothetical protein NTX45_13345 [Proteobacteria bacterium]|nr:hypothetical protein [Pseudomonadota bacterium]